MAASPWRRRTRWRTGRAASCRARGWTACGNRTPRSGRRLRVETNRRRLLQAGQPDEALPLMSKADVADPHPGPRGRPAAVTWSPPRDRSRELSALLPSPAPRGAKRSWGSTSLSPPSCRPCSRMRLPWRRLPAPRRTQTRRTAASTRPVSAKCAGSRSHSPPGPDDEHRARGAPVPGTTRHRRRPARRPSSRCGDDRGLPILSAVREIALGCPRCGLANTAGTWCLARGVRTRT